MVLFRPMIPRPEPSSGGAYLVSSHGSEFSLFKSTSDLLRNLPFKLRTAPATGGARKRRGTAALEFAFIGPIFFLFVFAIFEIGRGFMVVDQLNSAADQGARTGSLSGMTSTDVQNAVNTSLKNVALTDASGNSLGAVKIYDGTTLVYDSSTSPKSPVTIPSGDTIEVLVSIPISKATWVPGGLVLNNKNTGSLTGSAILTAE